MALIHLKQVCYGAKRNSQIHLFSNTVSIITWFNAGVLIKNTEQYWTFLWRKVLDKYKHFRHHKAMQCFHFSLKAVT